MYPIEKAGLFRANEHAMSNNSMRFVDQDTPGTPAVDSATYDSTGDSLMTGIKYTGKDGVNNYIPFFRETIPDGYHQPITVATSDTAEALRDAILKVVEQHEVGPIVTVTKAGAEFTIEHTGSGTITDLVADGADVDFTRAAISGVATAEQPEVEVADLRKAKKDELISIAEREGVKVEKGMTKADLVEAIECHRKESGSGEPPRTIQGTDDNEPAVTQDSEAAAQS